MSASGLINFTPKTYIKFQELNTSKRAYCMITIKAQDEDNYADLVESAQVVNKKARKDGTEIIEFGFSALQGYLQEFKVTEHPEYGKFWDVSFVTDSGKTYIWSIKFDASIFVDFINRLASIDGAIGSLTLTPYCSDFNNHTYTWVSVQNNGFKLPKKYDKSEIPETPPVLDQDGIEVTDSEGRVILNKKKKIAWLIGEVDKIATKLKAHGSTVRSAVEEEELDAQPY